MPARRIICDHCLCAICQWVSDLLGWSSPPVFLRQPPKIQEAQALCPCWSVPQLGSSGCGWLPWAAAPWGAWQCQPLWPHPIWWCGGPSMHALLLQTSPRFLSGRPLGVLSAWSPAFSWSHQCSSCHSISYMSQPAEKPPTSSFINLRWQTDSLKFCHAFPYCSLFVDIMLHFSGRLRGVWILVGFTVLRTHMHQGCVQYWLVGSPHFGSDLHTPFLPLYITDTPKTSPSSQEASESSQGFQQANMVPGHNEAECEKPNKGKSLNVCCELYTVHIIIKCPPNARMHGYGYGCLTNAQTGVHRCMNERLRQTGTGVWQILKPASDRMSMDMESY